MLLRDYRLDSQIIISKEDNTDFFSLGYIQTDTSLVSALGGALASFAEEIGLATKEQTPDSKNSINFSRFQNGILASKMIAVGDSNPIILIAIRGFDGEDKELNVIVDYAEALRRYKQMAMQLRSTIKMPTVVRKNGRRN